MTSTTATATPRTRGGHPRAAGVATRGGADRLVQLVVLLAVVARLPFVAAPAGPDEAGFMQVAQQWAPGGGSLYGRYWVDRPPLLISLYQLADLAGGLVALRLLAALAVVVTVYACAAAAGRLAGGSAARWAAVVAAALLTSPLVGSQEVNGELLSAPFVATGVLAGIMAVQSPDRGRARLLAAGCGAAGLGALAVKQNIVDVYVTAAVLLVASAWPGRAGHQLLRRLSHLLAPGVVGAALALGAVSLWTELHGTSMVGVFEATYPFRLRAAGVVATGGSQYAAARGIHLVSSWLASGMALLMVSLVWTSLRRPAHPLALLALGATVFYDAVSIALGGGYWLHYLVELVVPLAVWTGIVAPRGRLLRVSAVAAAAISALTIATSAGQAGTPGAQVVGAAVARVAQPGDTLTTLYGDARVNLAAGLPSPYEHLWSLPVKTLDPHLTELDSVLRGSEAPTWLVVKHDISSWGLDTTRTQRIIDRDYHVVTRIEGSTIYLHNGVDRSTPLQQDARP